jgi:branched-chain amino acid transport system substrate-binding protein
MKRSWIGFVVGAALVAASCGSDDSSSDSGAAETTAAATPSSAAETTSAASTDSTEAPSSSAAETTSASAGPATGDPYKIGPVAILSGPVAALGQAYQAGFDAHLAYINEHGGANGRPIELVVADDRNDPAAAATAYRDMAASDDALGVFGLISSNSGSAAQQIAGQVGVPIVGTGVVPPHDEWAFTAGLDPLQTLADEAALIRFLADEEGIETPKVAVVASDTVSGQKGSEIFQAKADELGFEVVTTLHEPVALNQFDTQAAAIANTAPDIVALSHPAGNARLMVTALRQAGVDVPIVNYWVGASEQLLGELQDPKFYVYRDYADPAEESAAEMRERATSVGHPDGTEFASGNYFTTGWVMAQLAHSVITACGEDCTPEKFRDLLVTEASNIDTGGLTGAVGFAPDDHVFVNEVRYFVWDPAVGAGVPVPGFETAEAQRTETES